MKKNDQYKIYLHVHLPWSSEIELNLSFRNFLRMNKTWCQKYEAIKIRASNAMGACQTTETGITHYNLLKNNIIIEILDHCAFDGICVRFANQPLEYQKFEQFKKQFFETKHMPLENLVAIGAIISKKFVLYQCTKIIGAAEIGNLEDGQFSINFAQAPDQKSLEKLLHTIVLWIKFREKTGALFALAQKTQNEIYATFDFMPSKMPVNIPSKMNAGRVQLLKKIF